jgi:alkylhydroperoxidase family enzyme
VLRRNGFSVEQLQAIRADFGRADLSAAEVAMMVFAQKITREAYAITPQDIDALRGHGFSDAEIVDIVLAAAMRNFYSRVADALGAVPDAVYLDLDAALREALTVGRPFGPGTMPAAGGPDRGPAG